MIYTQPDWEAVDADEINNEINNEMTSQVAAVNLNEQNSANDNDVNRLPSGWEIR